MKLIDADQIEYFERWECWEDEDGFHESTSLYALKEDIEALPTIESVPMKHAKPIVYYHGENTFSYECGACRMPIDGKDYYCRWCGAKMDEVEE